MVMGRFVYNTEMLLFLREGFQKMRVPELTRAFNCRFGMTKGHSAIRSALKNNKITCGRKPGFAKGEQPQLLNVEQVSFVAKNYKKMSRRELLAALNRRFEIQLRLNQLVAFIKNHGITSGRTGRYKKGSVPFNAGTKGVMKKNSGSFQQGSRPVNHRPVGSERIDKKDGYILVKVAEKNPWNSSCSGWYRHKHVVLWESVHGPIPEGSCLRFKDGNKGNIAIDNLALVSRGENARLNIMGYNGQPEEVRPIVMSLARLDQAVYELQSERSSR
jgi:hypothetical protein